MNKHIDIIRTNTDDMVVLAECNLLEHEIEDLRTKIKYKEECLNEYAERIDKTIDYIENNDLYSQDIDYDYDDNMVLSPPNDELERKELLEILKGENNE